MRDLAITFRRVNCFARGTSSSGSIERGRLEEESAIVAQSGGKVRLKKRVSRFGGGEKQSWDDPGL